MEPVDQLQPLGLSSSHQPITVSLTCHYCLSLGEVQLIKKYGQEVKKIIKDLSSYDTISINLKIHSTLEKEERETRLVSEQVKQHSASASQELIDDDEYQIDASRLEQILSSVYTLVEREKATREELMMVQVHVLIVGFSQLTRSQSPFFQNPHHPYQTERTLALGGTFDHLHSGHKILLTMACWLTTDTLIVGITDDELLKKKKYAENLQSVNERIEGVRKFIEAVGPREIKLETPILKDIYGPTATQPDIDAILVTKETVSGAESIDQVRIANHLKPLKRYVIDVISPTESHPMDHSNMKDLKISSTQIRAWLHRLNKT